MNRPQQSSDFSSAVANCRNDFPALMQTVNDHPLTYLDSAASSQQPAIVIDTVVRYQRADHANVHRGVHTLSARATDAYEAARDKLCNFINAASRSEVVLTSGTTEAINLVAQSFCRPGMGPGDQVLITHLEHHSNIVPWQIVCEQTGAELVVAPIDDAGQVELETLFELMTERVTILAIGHISNALGTVNPLQQIIEQARQRQIPVLVDGALGPPRGTR